MKCETRVFLVGAGPGDPSLLTVRALECLKQADVIFHDRLVSARVLELAPASAERKCVVRLKGGDPFIFGRGAEEAAALHHAGIPYEIVPGVTAALAAATCAAIPLTQRKLASAVAFITGHEEPGKETSLLDWTALASFPGTLAVYMPVARLAQVAQALIQHGKPPDTPAAAVRWASTPQQQTLVGTLADLPAKVIEAGLQAPAIVLVGPVVNLRPELIWFEQRPLFGKRILITRPRGQSADLIGQLERQGGDCISCPIVEIHDPDNWSAVDRALESLPQYDWLVFTSVNGVHALVKRLRQIARDLRALGRVKLAAIGPATGDALRGYHLEPDVVPQEFRSEALAAELLERVRGTRVLLARADRGRELLHEQLSHVAQVDQVAVYRQLTVAELPDDVAQLLNDGAIDFITLTSSNIARGLLNLAGARAHCRRYHAPDQHQPRHQRRHS